MPPFNSMQSNLGLSGSGSEVTPLNTPSPAQAAQMMSQQALEARSVSIQQLQTVAQYMGTTPSVAMSMPQATNQLAVMQYTSPQQMPFISPGGLSGFGGGGSTMPSPLQSSLQGGGDYQLLMSPVPYRPIPLMPPPPIISTPFTPQPPAMPLFTTAWEQELRNRDSRADSISALGAQIPSALGQLGAYGGAAMLGAQFMGGRFGGVGRTMGAIGGAALAQFSGVAEGMGSLAARPWRDQTEALEMGGAVQRMSSNFAIAPGPQRDMFGPGFNRASSIELGGMVQGLSQSSTFKQSTGGMFNQMDLMNIMGQAGQAGLMDQSQSISAVRRNLQMTAQTIREFMQLTNDPDVSNVIRTMATLHHQAGMDQTQMREAAANMRAYSRSAGMSIDALQSTGGMMGAATFTQAGLGPAAGYNYGMYSLSAARQGVAAGAYSPALLQQLGGVQGLAMREAQTQAAAFSMEPLNLAVSQRTPGGFQFDPNTLSDLMSTPGALGLKSLTQRAREQFKGSTANQLAMYTVQQPDIQDQLAQAMSPQQATLMKYRMAMDTGEEMGLTGASAFAGGARRLFGTDAARQMIQQGASNAFWTSQQQEIRMREYERKSQFWDSKHQGKIDDSDYLGFGVVVNAGKDALAAASKALLPETLVTGEYGFGRTVTNTYESAKQAINDTFSGSNWALDIPKALGRSLGIGTEARRQGLVTFERDESMLPKTDAEFRMMQREGVRAAMSNQPFSRAGGREFNLPGDVASAVLGQDPDRYNKWAKVGAGVAVGGAILAPFTGGVSLLAAAGYAAGAVTVASGAAELLNFEPGNYAETKRGSSNMLQDARTAVARFEELDALTHGTELGSKERNALEAQVQTATGLTAEQQQELVKGFSTRINTVFKDNAKNLSAAALTKEFNLYIGTKTAGGGSVLSDATQRGLRNNRIAKGLIREGLGGALASEEGSKLVDHLESQAQYMADAKNAIEKFDGVGKEGLRTALGESREYDNWKLKAKRLANYPLGAFGVKLAVSAKEPDTLTDDELKDAEEVLGAHSPLQLGVMTAMRKFKGGKELDAMRKEYWKTAGPNASEKGWQQVKDAAHAALDPSKLTDKEKEFIDRTTDTMKMYGAASRWLATKTRDNISKTFSDASGSAVSAFVSDKGPLRKFADVVADFDSKKIRLDDTEAGASISGILGEYKEGMKALRERSGYKKADKATRQIYEERYGETMWGKVVASRGMESAETTHQIDYGNTKGTGVTEKDALKAQQEFTQVLKNLAGKGGKFELFEKAVSKFASSVLDFKSAT